MKHNHKLLRAAQKAFVGRPVRIDAVAFFASADALRRIVIASGKVRRTRDIVREFKVSKATAKRDMVAVRNFRRTL